jgi:hypothetical protein
MDNQQESLRLLNLGWLAGIIDGEGTVTLRLHRRKNNTRTMITPTVTMVNTDKTLIDKYIEILKEYDIACWVTYYEKTSNWKARWKVEITGLRRCVKALPVFKDILVAKKELANIVFEWCEYRLKTVGRKPCYTQYDLDVLKKVKSFHGHQLVLKSSETICGTPEELLDEDIVRTA